MSKKEKWAKIIGYEDRYEISNNGRLKSLIDSSMNKREKIISLGSDKDGYKRAVLYKNSTRKYVKIHTLVCEYFLNKDKNRLFVNHKNGIKSDNRVENLEWCTAKENTNHAHRLGLIKFKYGQDHHKSSISNMGVVELFKSKEPYIVLAKKYNISYSNVLFIKHKKTWNWLTCKLQGYSNVRGVIKKISK